MSSGMTAGALKVLAQRNDCGEELGEGRQDAVTDQ